MQSGEALESCPVWTESETGGWGNRHRKALEASRRSLDFIPQPVRTLGCGMVRFAFWKDFPGGSKKEGCERGWQLLERGSYSGSPFYNPGEKLGGSALRQDLFSALKYEGNRDAQRHVRRE